MTLSSLASRRARRILVIPAALALSASALAACSDSGSTTTESSGASASASASEKADSAAKGEKLAGSEMVAKMRAALTDAGTYKTEAQQAGTTEPAVSEVVLKDGKSSSRTTANVGGPMEIISMNSGEEIYIKSEGMGVPTWTKVEASSENQAIATLAGMIDALRPMMDTNTALQVFEGSEYTNAGTEEVNGVSTTKWTGEISTADVMALISGGQQTAAPSGAEEKIPVEIYLDEKDRPVKWVQKAAGQTNETTFSDYGADITIEAPTVGS